MKTNHETLAAIAMHGILCACASPQFREKIEERAKANKVQLHTAISLMAHDMAVEMEYNRVLFYSGKKKGVDTRKRQA